MEILTKSSNIEIIEGLISSKPVRSTPPNCSQCLKSTKLTLIRIILRQILKNSVNGSHLHT
jgi:hypothetical protein